MIHRYIALTQPPYCCVPIVLLMILQRRGLPLMQVAEVGEELGLAVPKEVGHLYPKARIGVRPSSGYGTEIQNQKYSLNSFFERHRYPLRESYFPTAPAANAVSWIDGLLSSGADVVVCFNVAALYGGEHDWGHVCLINSIANDALVLIDPESQSPKFREVSCAKLLQSITKHGEGNRGGFWVIESI